MFAKNTPLKEQAQKRLPKEYFDYIACGYDSGITDQSNRDALSCESFNIKEKKELSTSNTDTSVLTNIGKLPNPLFVSPMSFHQLFGQAEGEIATAKYCALANVPLTVPMMSNKSLEEIAETAKNATLLLQMHTCSDLSVNYQLINRAKISGYKGIILTVDVPPLPRKSCDIRNNFHIPYKSANTNVYDQAAAKIKASLDWEDIISISIACQKENLPLYLKGITSLEDAKKSINLDIAGIIISNHGGRLNDNTISTMDALKTISKQLDGRGFDIFIDGGFESGYDVCKAIAWGANGVFLGRICAYALSTGEENALTKLFENILIEISECLKKLGLSSLTALHRCQHKAEILSSNHKSSNHKKNSELLSPRILF